MEDEGDDSTFVKSVTNSFQRLGHELEVVQNHINSFQYNYTGVMFYKLKKTGGTAHVKEVVAQIETYCLPIQCVEAVFLAAAMTDQLKNMTRIPLSFKSKCMSTVHRHIVLLVFCEGKWGALGISRRECLMYKPLVYSTLQEIIEDFRGSYTLIYHRLLTVYLGLPFPHNMELDQSIVWKARKVRLEPNLSHQDSIEIDEFLAGIIK